MPIRMSSTIRVRPELHSRWPAAQPVQGPGALHRPEMDGVAEQYKTAGNEYRKQRMFPQAIHAYETAIRVDPRFTDAYYNLAHLWVLLGNVPQGIRVMTQLLFIDPNDHDARVTLGEYYERVGNTQEAKKRYLEILSAKPDFDPANRHLQYLLYSDQKRFYPDTVGDLFRSKQQQIVHKSRELLKQYFTLHHPNPVLLELCKMIPVEFADTQKVDETPNIAEYDARRNLIRIHPQMMFSTPNVVAAYLAHELIHALDADSKTSIQEEQDGYRELARFWSIYQGAENDPNLDRALELYLKSPNELDTEVRRVYTIRDAGIPEQSPGHGLSAQSQMGLAFQAYEMQQKAANMERFRQLLALQAVNAPATNVP